MTFTTNPISVISICATEFSLTIALVVFVMLTLFLLTVLILLAVSKNFRTFFFRENNNVSNKPSESEQTEAQNTIDYQAEQTQTEPIEQKPKRRTVRAVSKVHEGIPTVPLNMAIADAEPTARKHRRTSKHNNSYSGITTVEIPPVETTYITRSSTIAKARKSSRKDPPEKL